MYIHRTERYQNDPPSNTAVVHEKDFGGRSGRVTEGVQYVGPDDKSRTCVVHDTKGQSLANP